MPDAESTLKVPTAKELRHFHIGLIDPDDRVRQHLEKGWSLAICCKDCRRLVEWTPPDLEKRFGERPDTRIRDIASRLSCAGEGGCGSREIAVFPHPYDWPWTWTPSRAG